MIIIKVDKKFICQLLNVKQRTLKTIESSNKLDQRLQKIGYNLLEKIKEGRKVYYIIEQNNINKELYSNLVKYTYKTNKENEFSKYFSLRTSAGENSLLSKSDISQISKVSKRTITTWDNTLIDYNIISKDGYYYFCIDKELNIIKQCTKEEYKSFWRNTAYIKAFKDLQMKYINGTIDLNQLTLASAEIGASIALVTNKYYYRIKKYKTNTENQLYIDTYNLIKAIYGNVDIEIKFPLIDI